jgi:hypothetical protein
MKVNVDNTALMQIIKRKRILAAKNENQNDIKSHEDE